MCFALVKASKDFGKSDFFLLACFIIRALAWNKMSKKITPIFFVGYLTDLSNLTDLVLRTSNLNVLRTSNLNVLPPNGASHC